MRYCMYIALILMGNVTAADAAFSKNEKMKVINISHLVEEDMNKIMHGEHSEIILEFSENTSLPLNLFLNGDTISLTVDRNNSEMLEIKQTFYVKRQSNEFLFSNNLRDWKPFFEFLTGKVSLSIKVKDVGSCIEIATEANLRQ